MSLPAATTFSLFQNLPQVLVNESLQYSNGSSLNSLQKCNGGLKRRVEALYTNNCRKNSNLQDVYNESNNDSTNIKERAESLAKKIKKRVGGYQAVFKATQEGAASIHYPQSQIEMANLHWNCKVIGLIPFFKAIPSAQAYLKEVAQMDSDRAKYQSMENWLKAHPKETAAVSQVGAEGYKGLDIEGVTKSSFYEMGGKIYNLLPETVQYFTGLKELSLGNNRLSELPEQLAQLPLTILRLEGNFLKHLPPPIPSLRQILLNGNQFLFSYEEIASFIEKYIEKGGESIEIFLDGKYSEEQRYQELAAQVSSQGAYQMSVEKRGDLTVFKLEMQLPSTQIIEN